MLDIQDLQKIRKIVKENNRELATKKDFKQLATKVDLQKTEVRIIQEVGKFIEDEIIPQIEEKADNKDIRKIKSQLGLLSE